MVSSGSNFLGLYGQSPRHAAALYTDARDSMRQATSTSSKRRSMQPPPHPTSSNLSYEEPHRPSGSENTSTPPPPYSCRASVLPETLPTTGCAGAFKPESHSSATPSSNSPPVSSRAQKRRSSVMVTLRKINVALQI